MSATGWTRRGALGLLIIGGGAVAGRLLWDRTTLFERPPAPDRFRQLLLESSHTAEMSASFGRLYLEQRGPRAADLSTLAAEVMTRLETARPWRRLYGPLTSTELETRLDEAIAGDFLAEGGICELDGWYLAQTECRLAAIKLLATS